jgi:hypothetical protein
MIATTATLEFIYLCAILAILITFSAVAIGRSL